MPAVRNGVSLRETDVIRVPQLTTPITAQCENSRDGLSGLTVSRVAGARVGDGAVRDGRGTTVVDVVHQPDQKSSCALICANRDDMIDVGVSHAPFGMNAWL